MASTFVDNYTIIDFVNTQSPASTQYNDKQKTGTLDRDLYQATSSTTHTIPSGIISLPDHAILDDGVNDKAIYETLLKIQVNWDNAMRQLDDTAGVGLANYEDSFSIGNLDTTYNSTNSTITLWADEGVVPEPETLSLLGLGALGLIRRRKA